MRASVVHVVLSRSVQRPGTVRWYVRHVWWAGPGQGARDRVVLQGEFDQPIGDRSIEQNVRRALEQALAALDDD